MSLFSELKNRNVFRVAAAYIVGAWLVIQVVETIFPAFGFGDSAVRVVVIVLGIGLIPALVFSWLFELTPEGFRRESAVDHSRPIAAVAVKKFDRAIIIILTLAVGFFAFDKFVLDPVRDTEIEQSTAERVRTETLVESYGDRSIAVLPFVNMSDDPGNEYFSDGIAEELLNLLAKVPRLRVISQSSSFSFKGKGIGIPEVAARLNVAYVLEGSVRKSGDRVRITAQLIEARSDTHLWSESYDRTLDDVFAIQDEISAAIVGELQGHLKLDIGAAPSVRAGINPEAHDAALRGRYLLAQRKPGSKKGAAAEFEKALSFDPDFAQSHAELALSLLLGGCGEVTDTQCLARATPHVEKAMALDPSLAEAHAASAHLSLYLGDRDEAGVHFRRALEINPNYASVYVWMAIGGLFSNQQEAFASVEAAVRLDPLSPLSNMQYIRALLARNQLAEADRQTEKLASIDPRFAMVLRGVRKALGGHWAEYILAYLEAANSGADELTYGWVWADDMLWHLAAIGLEEEALLMSHGEDALVLSLLGDPRKAIELALARVAESAEGSMERLRMSFALANAGRFAEARPYLEKSWQDLGQVRIGLSWYAGYNAEALIAALRDAGEEAQANQVLAEFKDLLRSNREGGPLLTSWEASVDYFEGIASYLAGDRDTGLALMSRAADDGYWIRPPGAFQEAMYRDPGFAPLLEKQKVRQAREREQLLEVVCTDNPYAAVWQPTEETCERYLSAGRG